jgi:predicted ATPase
MDLDIQAINILIGANGAGKSNFISFFKLMDSIYEQRLQDYIGNNINRLLYFGKKTSQSLSLLVEFQQEKENYKNAFMVVINVKQGSNQGYISTLRDYFNKGQFDNQDYTKWGSTNWDINVEESQLKNRKESRASYLKDYLKSFKIYHFHDTSDTSALKAVCELNDNRQLRENGSNLAAYLYYLQEQHPNSFKKIEMVVKSIAPFFDRFDLFPDQLNKNQIELRWQEKGNDYAFNAYHLSDGTLRFMALATLLLQPELPKIIIIDEPELGLHPFAINKLAGLIKKASAQSQIIIATQSVSIVDNFEPEDIITVDRKENQSVFQRQSSKTLKDWLQNYSMGDLWNKNVIGGRP